MTTFKYLYIFSLALVLVACGGNSDDQKQNFSINTNVKGNKITIGETLSLSLVNKNNLKVSNTVYKIGNKVIEASSVLDDIKLGKQEVTAVVTYDDGKTEEAKLVITVLNNQTPKVLSFEILNEYPHDITSYTQGLEFHNGKLYESTGQYNESKLREVDYKTGEVLRNVDLAPSYFGEGLTILNDKIYQLTWKEDVGFVYDLNTFEKTSSFKYGKSKQGWGICNDGTKLYKSDGTENIWTLNTTNLTEDDFIQVYANKGMIPSLNELEWINGKIYANIYQRNGVAVINPANGAVEAVIDFTPLRSKVTQHEGLDVLNGIAYNPETQTIFVTGKRWDKLFEVKIVEK